VLRRANLNLCSFEEKFIKSNYERSELPHQAERPFELQAKSQILNFRLSVATPVAAEIAAARSAQH